MTNEPTIKSDMAVTGLQFTPPRASKRLAKNVPSCLSRHEIKWQWLEGRLKFLANKLRKLASNLRKSKSKSAVFAITLTPPVSCTTEDRFLDRLIGLFRETWP